MTLSTRLLSCTMTLALTGGGIAVLAGPVSASPQHAERRGALTTDHGQSMKHRHPRMKFTAVGKVVAVDATARTITVRVKGGTRALHRMTVTLAVPADAVVRRNDTLVGLDAIQPGDHIAVRGIRGTDLTLTVVRMNASGPVAATPAPAPVDPTPAPAPAPVNPAPAPAPAPAPVNPAPAPAPAPAV